MDVFRSYDKKMAECARSAYDNYWPVIQLMESDMGKKLKEDDEKLKFPQKVNDVLEYLGEIKFLELNESEKDVLRQDILREIARDKKNGAKKVWQYKWKTKLETYYAWRIF